MEEKNLLIVCGEASGDLNAAGLTRQLLKLNPRFRLYAVGGPNLSKAGAILFADIKELSVIGLFDALKKLILEKIETLQPCAIILVDFSGFNLRLAKALHKRLPVIYYTSPQVWASRQGRVKTIKKYVDKMLVFFPFEKEFYRRFAVEADFVGHPLLDSVRPALEKKDFLRQAGLKENKLTLAILPGSRPQEVERILPVMLKAAKLLAKEIKEIQFVIAASAEVENNLYWEKISGLELEIKIIAGKTYDCLSAADFCLVASGTATLETAIMQKPLAVIYKTSLLNYLLYRPQVKVPFIAMANIVAGEKIVPEFIQFQASPQKIAHTVLSLLNNPAEISRIKEGLLRVKKLLGEPGASYRAARLVLEFLKLT
jgi:lipid-A-disaccharide synthase